MAKAYYSPDSFSGTAYYSKTPSGSTWLDVIDDPYGAPDDLTSYVSTTDTGGHNLEFKILNMPTPLGRINSLTFYARCKNLDNVTAGTATIGLLWYWDIPNSYTYIDEGLKAELALNDTWQLASGAYTLRGEIQDDSPWEWEDIPALGFILHMHAGASSAVACTQVYLEVDYEPYTVDIDDITLVTQEIITLVTLTMGDRAHTHEVDNAVLVPGQLIMQDSYHYHVGDNILVTTNIAYLSISSNYIQQFADTITWPLEEEDLTTNECFHSHLCETIDLDITYTPPVGVMNESLPALILFGGSGAVGTLDLGILTVAASGTVSPLATGELVFPSLTLEGTTGLTVALDFPSLALDATGLVAPSLVMNESIPALQLSAAGSVAQLGALSVQLPSLLLSSFGSVSVSSSASCALCALTLSATGVVGVIGAGSLTLPAILITATSYFDVSCNLTYSLSALECNISGGNKERFKDYILRWAR
jgi:hypothetical protein